MTNTLEGIKARLEKLEKQAREKKAKIEAETKDKSLKLKNQLKRVEQREKAQNRKRDTRRKILAGSLVLERVEKDEAFAAKFRDDLDEFLTRDIDRVLFELPVRKKSGQQETAATEA